MAEHQMMIYWQDLKMLQRFYNVDEHYYFDSNDGDLGMGEAIKYLTQ